MSSKLNTNRLCDRPTSQSKISMGTRLLAEQVRAGKVNDKASLVSIIINGAEDTARILHDVEGVTAEILRDGLVSAAVTTLGVGRVLSLLTGVARMCREDDLKESPSNCYQIALAAAAIIGNVPALNFLIDMGADVNGVTMFYGIPLHAAASGGHTSAMNLLLDKGADPNRKDLQQQCTPLYYTAMAGHETAAALLFSARADPNAANGCNETPLLLAARQGDTEVTALLLAQETVRPENTVDANGSNVIIPEVLRNHVDVVRKLLERPEVDVNEVDRNLLRTPLGIAAEWGYGSMVELLLSVPRVDKNARSKQNGRLPPLTHTANAGHADVVGLLLACEEVDVNRLTAGGPWWQGFSALTEAAGDGYVEIMQMLLEDPRVRFDDKEIGGLTPLTAAANTSQGRAAELLLARGADPNSKDNYGHPPLVHAAKCGAVEVVKALLDNPGTQVHGLTRLTCFVFSPLMIAACNGKEEVAKLLLAHKEAEGEPTAGHIRRALIQTGDDRIRQLLSSRIESDKSDDPE